MDYSIFTEAGASSQGLWLWCAILLLIQALVGCVGLWFLVFILMQINQLGRTPTLKTTVLDMKRAAALWARYKKVPTELDEYGNPREYDEVDFIDGHI